MKDKEVSRSQFYRSISLSSLSIEDQLNIVIG